MEADIAYEAAHQFEKKTGIKTTWQKNKPTAKDAGVDGLLHLLVNKNKVTLPVEIKKNISYQYLPSIGKSLGRMKDIVLLSSYIPEQIAKTLQGLPLNYMDAAGNAFIKTGDVFILLEGNKPVKVDQNETPKALSKTGIKVVFQFLNEPVLINDTIRNIAARTDVSLDTVHKTLQVLQQLKYIIPVGKNQWGWLNGKNLLEQWVNDYGAKLKPGLHFGNFRFVHENDFAKWRQIQFKRQTCWGGEPAGDILTNYLKPETLTIYTNEAKMDLIKNYKMIPDPNGYIRVYQKFWSDKVTDNNTAPILIVYADLINTGNKRNIETAQKIYGKFLQDKF